MDSQSPGTTTARSPSPEVGQAEQRLHAFPKAMVLVIDDDESIRTALAEIFELAGYQVAVAADGQEGVDLLEFGLEPNAIVLDLMMPRMNGWEFLSHIRGDPRYHDLPVLVTSAATTERPAGADACLPKPFEFRQLDRELTRLCAH